VLNKGYSDGLIRNIGAGEYNGQKYEIRRTPFPDASAKMFAVPTYVVNKPFGSFSKDAIGKIEKKTMRELLFSNESKTARSPICSSNGTFRLILYDQDNSTIEKIIKCVNGANR